jgi:hypothetical protein
LGQKQSNIPQSNMVIDEVHFLYLILSTWSLFGVKQTISLVQVVMITFVVAILCHSNMECDMYLMVLT